jgi:hypothetical protein
LRPFAGCFCSVVAHLGNVLCLGRFQTEIEVIFVDQRIIQFKYRAAFVQAHQLRDDGSCVGLLGSDNESKDSRACVQFAIPDFTIVRF